MLGDIVKRSFMNKRERAEEIVNRYVIYSLGAGLVPVPLLNTAAVTAVQIAMLRRLTSLYDVKFSESTLKALITSLLGSGGVQLGGAFLRSIPVLGAFLGGISIPVLSGAITYIIGNMFIEHFENGGTLEDFNIEKGKQYFKEQFDKAVEKVNEIKSQYLGVEKEDKVTTSNDDVFSKLEKLHQLKQKGIITEEEFENKKQELLKNL